MESLPDSLTIYQSSRMTDGGTLVLFARGPLGEEHRIELGKRWIRDAPKAGRLSLDGQPVPVRSESESSLLKILENATITYISTRISDPDEIATLSLRLRGIVSGLVSYIRSEEYEVFPRKE